MQEHLYRALSTSHGIVLDTDDVAGLIQKLHAARRAANDPALRDLVIARSRNRPQDEVWIIKQPKDSNAQANKKTP